MQIKWLVWVSELFEPALNVDDCFGWIGSLQLYSLLHSSSNITRRKYMGVAKQRVVSARNEC